jgi:hypothetical protein
MIFYDQFIPRAVATSSGLGPLITIPGALSYMAAGWSKSSRDGDVANGFQWKDAPAGYGPQKTLHNRFIRWSRLGVFDRIFARLAGERPKPERIMIDATHQKAHRIAASLLEKGMFPIVSGKRKAAELEAPHRLRR